MWGLATGGHNQRVAGQLLPGQSGILHSSRGRQQRHKLIAAQLPNFKLGGSGQQQKANFRLPIAQGLLNLAVVVKFAEGNAHARKLFTKLGDRPPTLTLRPLTSAFQPFSLKLRPENSVF